MAPLGRKHLFTRPFFGSVFGVPRHQTRHHPGTPPTTRCHRSHSHPHPHHNPAIITATIAAHPRPLVCAITIITSTIAAATAVATTSLISTISVASTYAAATAVATTSTIIVASTVVI